ncbi:hypothetical protein NE237_029705 [Protea cynaroides]|uniref:Late embryogenesis abundant protein LEA-2 subgroup domain-containing protein n=1 Tax=Protea cynaroides TaxID=273540 RepID=A0A9Q0GSB1_9MAGN|nr:hypothetical protein NE237_029705 [Protea cynaroides]
MDYYAPSAPLAPNPEKKRNGWLFVLMFFLGVLIFVVLLLLILGFTVFKPKSPTITIKSITVEHLNSSVQPPPSRVVYLNLTLKLDMSVKNPNKVSFKYGDSSAQLYYNGEDVGSAPIPAGAISAGETEEMNLMLTVSADRMLSDPNFYTDMLSGNLPLFAYTRIAGKVSVLNIVKKHVVTDTSCNVTLFLRNSTVASECSSKFYY